MRMLPETDEQLVYAAASACELMVAVAVWEQIDCAATAVMTANAGSRSFWVNILIDIMLFSKSLLTGGRGRGRSRSVSRGFPLLWKY